MWLGNHASHIIIYCCIEYSIRSIVYFIWEFQKMKDGYNIYLSWKWRLPRTNSKHLDIFLLHENERKVKQLPHHWISSFSLHTHARARAHADMKESKCRKETERRDANKKREWWIPNCCCYCVEKRIVQSIQFVIIIMFILHSVSRWTHSFHSHF